jgi:hypothetical protein
MGRTSWVRAERVSIAVLMLAWRGFELPASFGGGGRLFVVEASGKESGLHDEGRGGIVAWLDKFSAGGDVEDFDDLVVSHGNQPIDHIDGHADMIGDDADDVTDIGSVVAS